MRSLLPSLMFAFLVTMPLAGCGWFGSDDENSELELPEWLSEEDEGASTEPQATAFASDVTSAKPERLELNLRPGDRFPLRKVVEQELTQASLSGEPQTSWSQLELLLTITVDEVRQGRTRLQVMYDRVRYSHEVNGEVVEYDSSQPPAEIPPAVLAYHGMPGDGFAFWLSRENQIDGVDGFRDFLKRCLRFVPEEQRGQVMRDIEAGSGEQGIEDFVDSTIGLLPYDVDTSIGDSWERPQRIAGPLPMEVNTVCTLRNVTDQTAEVELDGRIQPLAPTDQEGADDGGVQITVTGGRCYGDCTIFRDTGLPSDAHLVREVDMKVQVAGGIEFDQHKRTVTTIEAYPAQTVRAASDPIGPRSR